MLTEYLFAHNGKYIVAAAVIKKGEAVYWSLTKTTQLHNDIHSIKVEADGTMDCRCSVRM